MNEIIDIWRINLSFSNIAPIHKFKYYIKVQKLLGNSHILDLKKIRPTEQFTILIMDSYSSWLLLRHVNKDCQVSIYSIQY